MAGCGPVRHARPAFASLAKPVATVTIRGIRSHGVRFALAIVAVTLGIAFVTGSFAFRDLLSQSVERTVATTLTADVYVRAPGNDEFRGERGSAEGGSVPSSLAEEIAALDDVAAAVPQASGPAALIAADGTVVDPGMGLSVALAPEPDPTTRLVSGSWPTPGQIVLESSTARDAGLGIGDETTVVLGGVPSTVRVVGTFAARSVAVGSVLIGIDEETASEHYAPDATVVRIAVFGAPGVGTDTLAEQVATVLDPQTARVALGADLRADASAQIERSLGFVRSFLLMFAGAALIAGGFVIANAFAMSVRERSHEFAVLRSVGTSTTEILGSVLTQAAVIGVVGSAAGVLLGGRVVILLQVGLNAWGMGFSGNPSPSRTDQLIGFTLGVTMSLVAAALPAMRAARVGPIEAIRTDAMPARRRGRAAVGVVILALGAGVLVAASRVGSAVNGEATGLAFIDGRDPQTLLLLGAGAVMAGVLLIAPSLTRPMVMALAAPVALVVGPLGRLARGNLVRDARRTANTAGGLLIGMSLVAFTGIAAESTRESLRSITDVEVTADLIVGSATGVVPPQAVETVQSTAGVSAVDVVRVGTGLVTDADGTASLQIAGIPADALGRAIDPVVIEGDPAAALARDEAVAMRPKARDWGWSVGDRIRIGPQEAQTEVVIGAIVDSHILGSGIVLADPLFETVIPESERVAIAAYVTAGDTPVTTLRGDLLTAVEPYWVVSVRDRTEAASAYAESVGEIVAIIYGVLALSVVIALLGIVNTLALSVIERTREIGLLRTVGVGTGQLAVVIALEAVLTSVYGTLLGVATGAGISLAVPGALADRGMSAFAVPWADLGVVIAAAVVIGLLASLVPAWRATRIPMLTAVATD